MLIVIDILQMQEGEEGQTYDLVLRVFYKHVAPVYSENGIARFLGLLSPDGLNTMRDGENSFVILAKDRSRMIGMLAVINSSHIALVFVDSEDQRKGVGSRLIDEAIRKCKGLNPDLSVITVSSSPNSKAFYEVIGFKAQGGEIEEDGMRFTPMHKLI